MQKKWFNGLVENRSRIARRLPSIIGICGAALLVACSSKSPTAPSSTSYHLTISAMAGGAILAPSSSQVSAAPGTAIAIKAKANTGYAFARWIVAGDSVNVGYLNSSSTIVKLFSDTDTISAQFVSVPSLPNNVDNSAFQKENGGNFCYYKGSWTSLPDFSSLTPDSSGPCDSFDVKAVSHQSNNFGAVFTGYLNIPIDGSYTFYLTSSDGSALLLNDSAIIKNDGIHSAPVEDSATLSLSQGVYLIQVNYFDGGSAPFLNAGYACAQFGLTEATVASGTLTRPFTGPVSKITVTHPAGGETYHLGDTIHVAWIYKNPRGQVFVRMSVDNGLSFNLISLTAFPGNITSYDYTIPTNDDSLVTTSAIIQVSEYPPFNLSANSKKFSIVQ